MLLISSFLSKLHKFKRSNYGFISWRKLCVMAAKCYYFGRIIMRIYEANYATRIYLCNPCKPWNRPYRPNPMNCLIRQQPLKTNPLWTSHVSACLGCKPGRNRKSRTMNRASWIYVGALYISSWVLLGVRLMRKIVTLAKASKFE